MSRYTGNVTDVTVQLYTSGDIAELTGTTPSRVRDWVNRSNAMGLYVHPAFIAGRGSEHRAAILKLWTIDQLDEIVEKFKEFEINKKKWHKERKQEPPVLTYAEHLQNDSNYEEEFDREREAKALEILNRMNQ